MYPLQFFEFVNRWTVISRLPQRLLKVTGDISYSPGAANGEEGLF